MAQTQDFGKLRELLHGKEYEYGESLVQLAIAEQTSLLVTETSRLADAVEGVLAEMKTMNKVETRTQVVPSAAVLDALKQIHESSHDDVQSERAEPQP